MQASCAVRWTAMLPALRTHWAQAGRQTLQLTLSPFYYTLPFSPEITGPFSSFNVPHFPNSTPPISRIQFALLFHHYILQFPEIDLYDSIPRFNSTLLFFFILWKLYLTTILYSYKILLIQLTWNSCYFSLVLFVSSSSKFSSPSFSIFHSAFKLKQNSISILEDNQEHYENIQKI